ncbi:MAG: SpoVR family protein [Chloroflexi bacterium]|nr:SpoVR family protein [Chloroflexota bacterium]
MNLSPELAKLQVEIEAYAREYGLDFFSTLYEVVDYKQMNQAAAYVGFPSRYPHWRFGMEYLRMSKSYAYGLHRIYEMVINNDPSYAYLLASNKLVDQKMVMAHVCGHVDFFKNNMWFAHTNRKMMDEMANHGTRIRRYIDRYGYETVERFLDCCLSLDNLIDIHSPGIQRRAERYRHAEKRKDNGRARPVRKLPSKTYMDDYINPPEFLEAQRAKVKEEQDRKKRFPERPERDVMLFLLEYAPLAEWQRDVLAIVREEAYYFAPQGQTKILNEGWASFWHSTIMTQKALEPEEVIDYAEHHAGTMGTSPGRLNPYKLGLELLRDIEERWDKGRFGKEWDECQDQAARRNWDRQLGLGRQKIFEVRRIYNDVGFIDTFLTHEFARRHKFFTYKFNPSTREYIIDSRDFEAIKRQLLFSLTNFGQPMVVIQDANYDNRGELFLRHEHEGIDLQLDWAQSTLEHVHAVWTRPVHLETVVKDKRKLFSFDGDEHLDKKL